MRRLDRAVGGVALALMAANIAIADNLGWDDRCSDSNWFSCCSLPFSVPPMKQLNWSRSPTTAPNCPAPPGPGDSVTLDAEDSVELTQADASIDAFTMSGESQFSLAGGLQVQGPIIIGNAADDVTFNWSSGFVRGAGPMSIGIASKLILSGSDPKVIKGRFVSNDGLIRWTGAGFLALQDATTLQNNPSGFFQIETTARIDATNPGHLIRNLGLMAKTSGGLGNTAIFVPFENHGDVQLVVGDMSFERGGMSDASFDINGDSVLTLNSSFTLAFGASVSGGGLLRISGGPVTVDGEESQAVSAEDVEIVTGGSVDGPAVFNIDRLIWRGGSMLNGGASLARELFLTDQDDKYLSDRALVATERVLWDGIGNLHVQDGAVFGNFGRFEIVNDEEMFADNGGGVLSNSGQIVKTASPGETNIHVDLVNDSDAVAQAQTGTLNFSGGGVSAGGQFVADAGAAVSFTKDEMTLEAGTNLSGGGQFAVTDSGTLKAVTGPQGSIPITNLLINHGGTLSGPGNFEIENMVWFGGTMRDNAITLVSDEASIEGPEDKFITGRRVALTGRTTWAGSGDIILRQDARVANSGRFVVENGQPLTTGDSTGLFGNIGQFLKLNRDETTPVYVRFDNSDGGTVDVETGSLELRGAGASNSSMNIAGGASIVIRDQEYRFDTGATVSGSGALRVISSLNIAGASQTSETELFAGGKIRGAGTLDVNGSFLWTGGALSPTDRFTLKGGTFVDGTADKDVLSGAVRSFSPFRWNGTGDLRIHGGARFVNADRLEILNNEPIQAPTGVGILENGPTGQLVKRSSGTTQILARFDCIGPVEVNAGTLSVSGGGTSFGSIFTIAGGAVLDFPRVGYTMQGNTDVEGGGLMRVSAGPIAAVGEGTVDVDRMELRLGGELSGDGTFIIRLLDWLGGTMSTAGGDTIISSQGALTIRGDNSKFITARNVVNNAPAIWSGTGAIVFSAGGRFDNRRGFDIVNDAAMSGSAGGVFENFGLVRKSGAVGVTTISVPFRNHDRVEVDSGIMNFTGGLNVLDGVVTLAGGDIAGTIVLEGGRLEGVGVVNGAVNNKSVVTPGAVGGGLLNVTGRYDQTAQGKLAVKLGSAQASTSLAVSGQANIAGTLSARMAGMDVTVPGATYEVIHATTRGGQFNTLDVPPGMTVDYLSDGARLRVQTPWAPGDLDADGVVAITDLARLLSNFGQPNRLLRDGDLTGDGLVDVTDLAMLISNFGVSAQ